MRALQLAVILVAWSWAASAMAQSASAKCPELAANSGLTWTEVRSDNLLLCRAVRDDGSDAFSLTFTGKPTFRPSRARGSAVTSLFGGQPLQWYRSEIAGMQGVDVREALMDLGGGQAIQFAVRAPDEAGVQRAFKEIEALRVSVVATR